MSETTVGYGDIAPQGWTKLVACLQIVIGVALIAVMLSKLTATLARRLPQVIERCSGDWIELTFIAESNTLVVSLVTIAFVDDTLRYDGDNFDQNGSSIGFFKGFLQEHSRMDNKLSFEYSNRHSETRFFDEGTTYLEFSRLEEGQYRQFDGFALDVTMHKRVFYGGWRATEDESKQIRSINLDQQAGLARKWAARYSAETGHRF